jgi:hypothetical protein
MKDETTKKIISAGADKIGDMLDYSEEIDRDELHNRLYNEDYFTIGTHQAKQELEAFEGGTFAAIEKVKEYEVSNFGEMNTEIDPEKIVNMLAYIVGEEALNECETYTKAEGNLTKEQLEAIKKEMLAQI